MLLKSEILLHLVFGVVVGQAMKIPVSEIVCARLNRSVEVAKSQPSAAPAALDPLEKIALGRADNLAAGSDAVVGLEPHLREYLADTSVRACALRAIGQIGGLEAVEFLSHLRAQDFGNRDANDIQQIWPSARVALQEALLGRVTDRSGQIAFLENALKERSDGTFDSDVEFWAGDELCNRGSITSLPIVTAAIRRWYSGTRGEEYVQFCETRVRIISRDSDRVTALSSSLVPINLNQDPKVTAWAVGQLQAMKSSKADAVLRKFELELDKVPDQFLGGSDVGFLKSVLRRHRGVDSDPR